MSGLIFTHDILSQLLKNLIIYNAQKYLPGMSKRIIYEQPVNELIRISLRIEHLFTQLDRNLQPFDNNTHTQIIMGFLIEILNLLDRPDLKSKLTQEFHRLINTFARLQQTPQVNHATLSQTLVELEELNRYLLSTPGKIAQHLRDNEFLTTVRQYRLNPGGGCSIDSPAYFYWLQQNPEIQRAAIYGWLQELRKVRKAIELLLRLVRQSSEPKKITAEQGFYQEALDSHLSCQLIRVAVMDNFPYYPEISAGKHRLSIRFLSFSLTERPIQTRENIQFYLTSCII